MNSTGCGVSSSARSDSKSEWPGNDLVCSTGRPTGATPLVDPQGPNDGLFAKRLTTP